MKVTVIGCGRWGSLITWYLDKIGHQVSLYGRASSPHMQRFLTERRNDLLEFPESVKLCTDLECTQGAEVIVISVPSQALQGLMDQLKPLDLKNKTFVPGFRPPNFCTLSQVLSSGSVTPSCSKMRAGVEGMVG